MATQKDVARRARVSVATVSHVLNNTKAVTPEVRSRVLQAAAALNYRINSFARSLRTGTSRTLGVVVPDITSPFFPELVQAMEAKARALGYTFLLVDSTGERQKELDGLNALIDQNVDGLIWAPMGDQPPTVDLPSATVVLSSSYSGEVDKIYGNQRMGGELQAELAISHGHKHVALLNGLQTTGVTQQRRAGFLDTARPHINLLWEQEVPFSLNLPARAMKALQQRGFTLLVAANDTIAIAALRVLLDTGIRVPEDVSIIGFDDVIWASLVNPPLTTVRQPIRTIGIRAVEMLYERIQNPDLPYRTEILDLTPIKRRSLLPVNLRKELIGMMPRTKI